MLINKIRYLLIIVFTGLLAILYNVYFMGILFITILILPFILFANLCYVYGKLSYELIPVVHIANKDETIPISIQFKNPTIFPISNLCFTISYCNSYANQNKRYIQHFNISVDKKSTTIASCNLVSQHVGNLKISIPRVRVYDYLKLFSLKKKKKGEILIAVLPIYYELTDTFMDYSSRMQVESDYFSSVKKGDDPSEVFAIREYREGDRPQRIHWKLSIKENQLMIKDFSEPMNCSVVIFADLDIPKEEELLTGVDSILECAISLSYTFIQKGQIHYLVWYDRTMGTCRRVRIVEEKDLFEAMDGLLSSGPCNDRVDLAGTYYAEYPNDQYTDLFYVTKIVTQIKYDSLLLIKTLSRQILHVNGVDRDVTKKGADFKGELPIATELVRQIAESGMGIISVSSSHMKRELEELKLT